MSVDLQLAESFAANHHEEAAGLLASMETGATLEFVDAVSDETAAPLLGHMPPIDAARIVSGLDPARATELLRTLGHHRSVLILRRLDRERADAIITGLPDDMASKIARRIRYPKGSAGWLADTSADPLPDNLRAADAVERGLDPRFPYVYLVDADHRLVGAVHLNDILTRPDHRVLATMARPTPIRISARTNAAELATHRAWSDLDVLPVVDSRGVYVGALRHKVLRQLQSAPSATGVTATSFASMLELAEIYWMGLSSVVLPVSRPAVDLHQESSNER
ncbi:MAG: hypothetical protein V2I67_14895 [Thermoanaerobaculales bacterium]|jgi:magnesium transporter|nr:hypothetical protein [Thermoanaerobaculales bacterium]